MSKKVSVYVTIPDTYQKYNFLIPNSMQINSVQKLICRIINRTEQSDLESANYQMLCVSSGTFIPPTYTLEKAGITDGTVLLMVKER